MTTTITVYESGGKLYRTASPVWLGHSLIQIMPEQWRNVARELLKSLAVFSPHISYLYVLTFQRNPTSFRTKVLSPSLLSRLGS